MIQKPNGDVQMNKAKLNYVGCSTPKVDAVDKVLGRAVYAEDIRFPDMLYGRVRWADIPHGIIEEIDVSAAKAMAGVVCVLTARDVPGNNRFGIAFPDQWALAEEKVLSIGDAVAIVAAETDEIAKEAVKAIRVNYRELPVLSNLHEALADNAPQLHVNKISSYKKKSGDHYYPLGDGGPQYDKKKRKGEFLHNLKGNVFLHTKVRKGDIEQGFEQADVIVENTYKTHVVDHVYLETESGVGKLDEHGNLVIWNSCQYPFRDRRQVASVLGIPQNKVRIIRATTGGAFGGKEDVNVEIHIGLLVHATRRPVRMVWDREESMSYSTKRHAFEIWTRWGATSEGKLCAMEGKVYGDTGAYAGLGIFAVKKCGIHLAGPYYIPHIKVDVCSVYTNNINASAMRGFGVPQAAIAHEGQMDELARGLGINPLTFRLMNALDVGLSTETGHVMTQEVGIKATLEKLKAVVLKDPSLASYWEDLK